MAYGKNSICHIYYFLENLKITVKLLTGINNILTWQVPKKQKISRCI